MFAASFLLTNNYDRSLEYFELVPNGDSLCPAGYSQLAIDIADMAFYGRDGDDQLIGDILIGTAGLDQFQNLHLAHGQRLDQKLH